MLGSLPQLGEIGVRRLRIDGRAYEPQQIRKLTRLYKEGLAGGAEELQNLPGTTRGHYYRGVL